MSKTKMTPTTLQRTTRKTGHSTTQQQTWTFHHQATKPARPESQNLSRSRTSSDPSTRSTSSACKLEHTNRSQCPSFFLSEDPRTNQEVSFEHTPQCWESTLASTSRPSSTSSTTSTRLPKPPRSSRSSTQLRKLSASSPTRSLW